MDSNSAVFVLLPRMTSPPRRAWSARHGSAGDIQPASCDDGLGEDRAMGSPTSRPTRGGSEHSEQQTLPLPQEGASVDLAQLWTGTRPRQQLTFRQVNTPRFSAHTEDGKAPRLAGRGFFLVGHPSPTARYRVSIASQPPPAGCRSGRPWELTGSRAGRGKNLSGLAGGALCCAPSRRRAGK
jgi:hypothetical protein